MNNFVKILLLSICLLTTKKNYGQSTFEWPNTPGGQVFKEFLSAYNTGKILEIRSFIEKNYNNPTSSNMDEISEYWLDLFYRFGPAKPHSVSINKPHDLEIWLQGIISKAWFAPEFILDKETGKIKAEGLLLGERPPNTITPAFTIEQFFKRTIKYIEENERHNLFQGAVAILQNEEIIINAGYGFNNQKENIKNEPNTRFDIASLTKPITAIAILQLVQKGLLDLSTPIEEYLPEMPINIAKEITISQLLTHTSGYKLKGIPGFREDIVKSNSLKEVYQIHLKHLPKWSKFESFKSHTQWNYSNQGYDLLAIIIENITQLPFEEYIKINIFDKAKMTNTSFSSQNVAKPYRYSLKENGLKDYSNYPPFFGKVSGASELKSTTRDLINLFNYLKDTNLILDEEHKALLFSPITKRSGDTYQSLGLKIEFDATMNIGHSGVLAGNTSELYYFPKLDILVIILCNNRSGAPNLLSFIKNNLPRN